MVTIEISKASKFGRSQNRMKTTRCPRCNVMINSWAVSPQKCNGCKCELLNTNDIAEYKFARIAYHKEGSY